MLSHLCVGLKPSRGRHDGLPIVVPVEPWTRRPQHAQHADSNGTARSAGSSLAPPLKVGSLCTCHPQASPAPGPLPAYVPKGLKVDSGAGSEDGATRTRRHLKAVVGGDDRREITAWEYPWSAIAYVNLVDSATGTVA